MTKVDKKEDMIKYIYIESLDIQGVMFPNLNVTTSNIFTFCDTKFKPRHEHESMGDGGKPECWGVSSTTICLSWGW
jgi:hypothetical protein